MARDGSGNPRLLRDAGIPRGTPGDAVVRGLLAHAQVLRDSRRRRKALPVLAEAVAVSRELTESDPLGYSGLLARSLRHLSGYLVAYGKAGDALPLAEEAVGLARVEGGGALAIALYARAKVLRALGRHDEAADCEAEAATVKDE